MKTPFILNTKQRNVLAENTFKPSISKEAKNIRESRTFQGLIAGMAKCCEGIDPNAKVYIEAHECNHSYDVNGNRTAHYWIESFIDDELKGRYHTVLPIGDNGSRRKQIGYSDTENGSISYHLQKLGYDVKLVSRVTQSDGSTICYTYQIVSLETVGALLDAANGYIWYSAEVEGVIVRAPTLYTLKIKLTNLVSRAKDRSFSIPIKLEDNDYAITVETFHA